MKMLIGYLSTKVFGIPPLINAILSATAIQKTGADPGFDQGGGPRS